uniref:Ras association domain family member 7 n=1 Tax=Cyclopterus lumpus TaxID=8103 RepID=A0A8C2YYT7_CYCLU
MELKVWVEGVVRVVCGLSLNTSCQDVVIALAKSLGQTGRYILLVQLRGEERQLVATDCPLQHLAQLGPLAAEVHFVLRRTGPSRAGEDTPGPAETKPNRAWSPSPRASPEPRASPVPETEAWERSSDEAPGPAPVTEGELEDLERRLRQNEEDLMHRHQWEEELRAETDREPGTWRLQQLHSSTQGHGHQIEELHVRAAELEQDLQLGAHRRSSRAEAGQPEEALRPLEQELQYRRQQAEDLEADLEAALSGTQRDLQRKEEKLQGRREVLEELNKELRQCKLQHFILQTGGPHADQTNLPGTEVYLSNAGLKE